MSAKSYGTQSGYLCACGCGRMTRRYGQRICRFVEDHYARSRRGQHAGYIVEDRGYLGSCWIWQGGTQSQGYGRMSVDGKLVPAHRHYYEATKGPVPIGLQLDHLCHEPSCVNPDHLEPVTSTENLRRSTRTILTFDAAVEIKAVINAARAANGGRVPSGLYADLATRFGTRKDTIRAIRKGQTWRDA
jgi:HNH endonuclease